METYLKLSVSGEKQILIFPFAQLPLIGANETVKSWLFNQRIVSMELIGMKESDYENLQEFEFKNKETRIVLAKKKSKKS